MNYTREDIVALTKIALRHERLGADYVTVVLARYGARYAMELNAGHFKDFASDLLFALWTESDTKKRKPESNLERAVEQVESLVVDMDKCDHFNGIAGTLVHLDNFLAKAKETYTFCNTNTATKANLMLIAAHATRALEHCGLPQDDEAPTLQVEFHFLP